MMETITAFLLAIVWKDPVVQAAALQAIGAVLAAVIAAICVTVIGRKFANREKLQTALEEAATDIEFLLAVEENHCLHHLENGSASNQKRRMRAMAKRDGHEWSGRFTPGRNAANKLLR
jgi:hypothetical protein